MNELNIYKLFQNIFDKSSVIDGRFSVATGYGSSLDDEKVGDYITQTLKPKKYPLVALFPPIDFPKQKITDYKMKMLFILQHGEGSTGIKDALANNTTGHPLIYDWKDMRECALNFMTVLDNASKLTPRKFSAGVDMIERFSSMGTSNLSGIALSFEMKVFEDNQCRNSEYTLERDELQNLLSNDDIHPQHQH